MLNRICCNNAFFGQRLIIIILIENYSIGYMNMGIVKELLGKKFKSTKNNKKIVVRKGA